uniref:Uncharacterized protein n=1 Tax=Romanomermis culicivorax TaxID=13658 RepID=A0A915KVM7_ROMCU
MARLKAHIVRLRAQQMVPPLRNRIPSRTPFAHIQNAGDHPSGAHLQMCSYHGRCTHNDASCRAQHPDSAGPSNAATTTAAVVSALASTSALPPPPLKYAIPVNVNPSTMLKMTGDVSVVTSYRPTEDSSSITNVMRAVWSMDLAKKYLHLP